MQTTWLPPPGPCRGGLAREDGCQLCCPPPRLHHCATTLGSPAPHLAPRHAMCLRRPDALPLWRGGLPSVPLPSAHDRAPSGALSLPACHVLPWRPCLASHGLQWGLPTAPHWLCQRARWELVHACHLFGCGRCLFRPIAPLALSLAAACMSLSPCLLGRMAGGVGGRLARCACCWCTLVCWGC